MVLIEINLDDTQIKLLKRLSITTGSIKDELEYSQEMNEVATLWRFEWVNVINALEAKIDAKGTRDKDALIELRDYIGGEL